MNCEYCGAELRPDARYCIMCGMPVSAPAEAGESPAAEAAPAFKTNFRTGADTVNGGALKGYTSYTTGEHKAEPAPSYTSARSIIDADEGPVWAAWVALICAVLSLKGALLVVPGILLGLGAIIIGAIGCRSELRALSICDIVIGSLGVLLSIVMIMVWSGVFGLASSFMGSDWYFF